MDNQQLQASLELIKRLLVCSQGEEVLLLEEHASLVNTDFVQMMRKYSDYLEQHGSSSALRLRKLADEIEKKLTLEEESNISLNKTIKFLDETFQLIENTQFDPHQVYPFWSQNQSQLNEELLDLLPEIMQFLLDKSLEEKTDLANMFFGFGNLINQFPLGLVWLNLELGIIAYESALKVIRLDTMPDQWAQIMNNLALAYSNRIRGDRAENIEQAINTYHSALKITRKDLTPIEWAQIMGNLGTAYAQRIIGDRAENIEQAINAYQDTLTVRTKAAMPVEWAGTAMNLANVYSSRIRGDRAENIEQAIELYKNVLTIVDRGLMPLDWAQAMSNLANAFITRIRGDRQDNIEKAIEAYQSVLTVMMKDIMPVQWAQAMNNLAVVYMDRIKGGLADNIEQAIIAYQEVLTVRTESTMPIEWAQTMANLASGYFQRVKGDRAENIEQAIATYQSVFTVISKNALPIEWATAMLNLASAYSQRIKGDRAENIEQAIAAYQDVTTVFTRVKMPIEWAQTLMNLASAYYSRIQGDREENIEQAIWVSHHAITMLTQDAMPTDWAKMMNNLACFYSFRIQGDRAKNIEQAIEGCRDALTVRTQTTMPTDWAQTMNNLGYAYYSRVHGVRMDNLEQAIDAYRQALSIFTPELLPKECRSPAFILGNIYVERNQWAEAIAAYQIAIQASENLYQSTDLLDSKAAELSEVSALFWNAAYTYARDGQIQQAIETLEQARARGLSENLNRDRVNQTKFQQLAPHLYNQYKDITEQLRDFESQQRDRTVSADRNSVTPEYFRNTAKKIWSELKETIVKIRQVPGYEDFLTPTKWEDIALTLRPGNPLIYIVTTSNGSFAIIVTPDKAEAIWFNVSESQLSESIQVWFKAYSNSQADRQTWYDTIDSTTHHLWDLLMGPIVQRLKILGYDRATLIPTGYLSLLPLHAAWTPDPDRPTGKRYALDDIHFTYTPNARSLTAARAIADCPFTDSILAIDNPQNDLPNSNREINCAIASFSDRTVFSRDKATIAAVKSKLSGAAIVHFSCHGTANFDEPLSSGLLMSDGLLTLKDILAINLAQDNGIRLAILSACETGLPGFKNIDEFISLPIGLLQAGVAGVIASLWAVSDLSTMMLLVRFYDYWREEGLDIDQSLRKAQQWVRDTTNNEKSTYFESQIPALTTTRMTPETANMLYESLAFKDPDARDFAHPYFWSAFSYFGV